MEKFRISVIDGLAMNGQISVFHVHDVTGAALYLGDTVERKGERFLVGYRYGQFVLLPMVASCYLSLNENSEVTKLNAVTASTDQFIAIGYTNEPLYHTIKDLVEIQTWESS